MLTYGRGDTALVDSGEVGVDVVGGGGTDAN